MIVIHGDDFVVAGRDTDLEWVVTELSGKILMKKVGVLGGDPGDVQEMRVLNRVLRWEPWGIAYEADPRHAELLIQALGDRIVPRAAPGVKGGGGTGCAGLPGATRPRPPLPRAGGPCSADSEPLPWDVTRLFRACAARANYLGMDRVDIAFAAKAAEE